MLFVEIFFTWFLLRGCDNDAIKLFPPKSIRNLTPKHLGLMPASSKIIIISILTRNLIQMGFNYVVGFYLVLFMVSECVFGTLKDPNERSKNGFKNLK